LRARQSFQKRLWQQGQLDAVERLDLYKKLVDRVVEEIGELLAERDREKLLWVSMKAVYSGLISQRDDWELAETFFNSVTRRIFATVGLDPRIEFVDTDFDSPPTSASRPIYRIFTHHGSLERLVADILHYYDLGVEYEDFERDVRATVREISGQLEKPLGFRIEQAEMIEAVFYRGKGAFLIGRLCDSQGRLQPFAVALLNLEKGLTVDAVLLEEDELNIMFSFTRSYFFVRVARPYDMVWFLKSIMPQKRTAELYISLGFNKHGKTELYRNLLEHLATSSDEFEIARGIPGMVMTVFTLPSYDMVFKIIKDRFDFPKTNTPQEVMAKYQLVFKHDRAGRLIDAQEFEHLKFERSRFSEPLLAELQRVAAKTVTVGDKYVIIRHAYIERRVTPLNLYLQEAGEAAARAAVIDCGNTIKDLAATNIFAGDMLLKNFGVTRHGRVVFYDYDELTSVTACNFRNFPQPSSADEELAAEPWYGIDENDVFPEEFKTFLGLHGVLRQVFIQNHAGIFSVDYWWKLQQRLRNGEILDIFPYQDKLRLTRSS
jgi:isocitrate dehydrogenase kinase/phosphatase